MAPGLNLTLSNFHSKHISLTQSFQKAWITAGSKGAVFPHFFSRIF